MEYTALLPTPEIFRKWAGISALGGAMERRCWLRTDSGVLYPNTYIMLVGPPGTGKDPAIDPVQALWTATGELNLAPTSTTHKGLMDALEAPEITKTFTTGEPGFAAVRYNSLLVACPELGTMLPEHNLGYMSMLNELYQCKDTFSEHIRGRDHVLRIDAPHLHMLLGTQPDYLAELLPNAAFGMGFVSRLFMVYHPTPTKVPLFSSRGGLDSKLFKALVHDLKRVCALAGRFQFTGQAEEFIQDWHLNRADADAPKHTRLLDYKPKRIAHYLKALMAMCVSESSSMVVDLPVAERTLELLREAEYVMPGIFQAMRSGGSSMVLDEAAYFVYGLAESTGKPCNEAKLMRFLGTKVPSGQVRQHVDLLLQSELIKEAPGISMPPGNRMFIPGDIHLNT